MKACLQCLKTIPEKMASKSFVKFCSKGCRMKYHYKPILNPIRDTCRVGTANELIVASDLLKKGFNVFKALCPVGCDLAVLMNDDLILVEVTTGRRNRNGQVAFPKKDHQKFDVLAVVIGEDEIVYIPELQNEIQKEIA